MVWRRVHVLRPSSSTSGGQSEAGTSEETDVAREVVELASLAIFFLAMAAQSEKADLEVQERQL